MASAGRVVERIFWRPDLVTVNEMAVTQHHLRLLPSPARHGGCKKDRNRRAACPLPGQGEGSGNGHGDETKKITNS